MRKITDEVYTDGRNLYTQNLIKGRKAYGELIVRRGSEEYRHWDPKRSKLSALIKKGWLKPLPEKNQVILYLGAAQGTTPSHVSDIVGEDGLVIAVEFSPKAFEKLLPLCEERENMIPVLADARKPEEYEEVVPGKVDLVYADIAQKDQAEIASKNALKFLKKQGVLILMVKARSIDVTKDPPVIFEQEKKKLSEKGFKVLGMKKLDPYERDHAAIICQKTV